MYSQVFATCALANKPNLQNKAPSKPIPRPTVAASGHRSTRASAGKGVHAHMLAAPARQEEEHVSPDAHVMLMGQEEERVSPDAHEVFVPEEVRSMVCDASKQGRGGAATREEAKSDAGRADDVGDGAQVLDPSHATRINPPAS
eukprot:CAMPEP_0206246640 /NCGR_PEP_ID=MMETSP0047_2-20121206/19372_1 /ASSEMBLY_ACC=CAM_ASM_000192 /TAXON_ID=195065 /ORGANISM="Chroomonas mesostigmatica_cf, Strain CCMP1168" /LENGTH=143 /DNA_ID=CAMNT_0053672087 /DNA_START=1 /DNA_END=429 /DNA_ORIENTATION=-